VLFRPWSFSGHHVTNFPDPLSFSRLIGDARVVPAAAGEQKSISARIRPFACFTSFDGLAKAVDWIGQSGTM
jgi:hypothetical protein